MNDIVKGCTKFLDRGINFAVTATLLFAATVIGIITFSLYASAASDTPQFDYGTNGYRCVKENTKSNVLLIGDARVCQMGHQGQYNASTVAVWGGRYRGDGANAIDSASNKDIMEKYIRNILTREGSCEVYIFASAKDLSTKDESTQSVKNIIKLARSLDQKNVNVTVVEMVGEKGAKTAAYNGLLKRNLPSQVGWLQIADCLEGVNSGYSKDKVTYNKKTLDNIWKTIL